MLELKNLDKSFGGVKAVNGLSLEFRPGKVTALIGPNGAGKTTVFNLIGGFLRPDAGSIFYRGKRINSLSPWRVALYGIGRLFQDVRVFNRLTVIDNVLAGFKDQAGERIIFSVLGRRRVRNEERVLTGRALDLLDLVGMADKACELAGALSYGQQKLLVIARLLAADASTLLLDEPAAGVSPAAASKLLGILKGLAAEGKTLVVIEHDMSVVSELADLVIFIDRGSLAFSGTPSQVLANSQVKEAYIGL